MINRIKQELEVLKSIRNNWFTEPFYITILELINSIKKIKLCYYSTKFHTFVEFSDSKKQDIKECIIKGCLIDASLILEGLIKEKEWELSYYEFISLKNNLDFIGEDELITLWERFHSRSFMATFNMIFKLRYKTLLKKYAINNDNESPIGDIINQIGEEIMKRGL